MNTFKINFLDHVAIKVKDINISIAWYERVLHLKRASFAEWNNYPVCMLSGETGVAIFPAKGEVIERELVPNIRIDHFAFNVNNSDFENAKKYFTGIGEAFQFQDHIYFHSVYLKDPDGHTVELTTQIEKKA